MRLLMTLAVLSAVVVGACASGGGQDAERPLETTAGEGAQSARIPSAFVISVDALCVAYADRMDLEGAHPGGGSPDDAVTELGLWSSLIDDLVSYEPTTSSETRYIELLGELQAEVALMIEQTAATGSVAGSAGPALEPVLEELEEVGGELQLDQCQFSRLLLIGEGEPG
jgi:hypothetical protein